MQKLIRIPNGKEITLESYQDVHHLFSNQLSKHFSVEEFQCSGEMETNSHLLDLLEAFRTKINHPVKINSGYRTPAKQRALKAAGFKAATVSPHCFGMAADIDTTSREQTYEYVTILKEVAKSLNLKIRLGYEQYLDLGQTFVHVDVCPEFYAKGKPLYNQPHHPAWENAIEW
ncbi:MAG: DUF882 domain-containing protein [Sphingobacteriales bacterium]|nr:MAG: DUF882 domain-containing protein [Sphingobacteriales bacterium]